LRYSFDFSVDDHGSPVIFRSVFQSDPNISSIKTSTMITTANSLLRESGMPNHLDGAVKGGRWPALGFCAREDGVEDGDVVTSASGHDEEVPDDVVEEDFF
jgi:hypothetical protein